MSLFARRPEPRTIILGYSYPKNKPIPISIDDDTFHALVIGRSGSGKSRFLQSLFHQYLYKKSGILLLDPHHDTGLGIIAQAIAMGFYKHSDAFERLIYLNF